MIYKPFHTTFTVKEHFQFKKIFFLNVKNGCLPVEVKYNKIVVETLV